MLCKIADLLVSIPTTGGMSSRCREYFTNEERQSDIIIRESLYESNKWPEMSLESNIYLQSGFQFYYNLLRFDGMMLHASAVSLDGKAYLFSGNCGVGKSTHTGLWKSVFGDKVEIFNDDKPALRRFDDGWYAYGTPWCGKDGININMKVPLGGICFLKQGTDNSIRRLENKEAVPRIIFQTMYQLRYIEPMDKLLEIVGKLVEEVPIYELCNRPEPEAALLSYNTMRTDA